MHNFYRAIDLIVGHGKLRFTILLSRERRESLLKVITRAALVFDTVHNFLCVAKMSKDTSLHIYGDEFHLLSSFISPIKTYSDTTFKIPFRVLHS